MSLCKQCRSRYCRGYSCWPWCCAAGGNWIVDSSDCSQAGVVTACQSSAAQRCRPQELRASSPVQGTEQRSDTSAGHAVTGLHWDSCSAAAAADTSDPDTSAPCCKLTTLLYSTAAFGCACLIVWFLHTSLLVRPGPPKVIESRKNL